ncbi:hypothetical protein BDFB_009755 [Asbolus verrucosus]|uniref:Uncharacterized protein n=1 Tax=Asbolus verrucosus TaxID=1661398 RepID=A0A482VVG9_ASBVE|nr:hypothetical protein BDFB_009755 [Asbolus verrucosus]
MLIAPPPHWYSDIAPAEICPHKYWIFNLENTQRAGPRISGYYMIERKMLKLQIVVLNTNLMKKGDNDEEATEQWRWLNAVLQKFQRSGETVSSL